MRKVTLPDGRVIEYLIDGYNRRIGKRIDGNLVKTWTYKDQINPVIEVSYDEFSAGTAKFFVYATRPHVPDYMIMNDVRYTIVSDHLGSVRQVMNSQTGEMLQEQNFEAFGMRQDFAGEQVVPFGFAGGLYDEDTGLIRFGARDYDPHSGRWTTKDPIRFDGDAVNLYRYANNDPVNFVDPSGLINMADVGGGGSGTSFGSGGAGGPGAGQAAGAAIGTAVATGVVGGVIIMSPATQSFIVGELLEELVTQPPQERSTKPRLPIGDLRRYDDEQIRKSCL